MDLRNTPTGKGLAAICRQEIIQDVTLFTSQSAAAFYDKLFSSLDFTLPRAATGRRGFPKEAMVCAFIVMKCEGFSQITDLADYLDNNRLIAHYSRVGGLYIWNYVEWSIYIIGLMPMRGFYFVLALDFFCLTLLELLPSGFASGSGFTLSFVSAPEIPASEREDVGCSSQITCSTFPVAG